MAIKAGAILHDVNGYVIDRIQSGGPGNLNIPEEKIYELGNWQSIATIRDIPDLSFDLESFDVSTEFESILTNNRSYTAMDVAQTNLTPADLVDGEYIKLDDHIPIDVISPFKSRRNQFNIVRGLGVPYLTLERASYRYGLRQNAAQSFTLRGDSIYYIPGQPYYQEELAWGGGTIVLDKVDPVLYQDGNDAVYALCVVLVNSVTGAYKRLYYDSTDTLGYNDAINTPGAGQVTVTISGYDNGTAEGEYDIVRIVYGAAAADEYDPGADWDGLNPSGNLVHETFSTKPAAVRPKDIDVYLLMGASETPVRLTGVQSAEVNWSVTLEQDEEFGNSHYVGMDYDIPDVSGSIGVKPYDPADLWTKLSQITGVTEGEVVGPNSVEPVGLEVRINHPDTGNRLKTLYVPDARFQVPGLQGRIQTKLETSMSWTSDSGELRIYKGARS